MKRCLPRLAALVAMLLAGCAGLDSGPSRERQPIIGLGAYAADQLLAHPDWPLKQRSAVVLISPPQIDAELPVSRARFEEALTRGLLSHADAPQVLNWTPAADSAALAPNQWLLDTRLALQFGPLALSDRRLYPYRLTLILRRSGEAKPYWQTTIEGAFDSRSLDNP